MSRPSPTEKLFFVTGTEFLSDNRPRYGVGSAETAVMAFLAEREIATRNVRYAKALENAVKNTALNEILLRDAAWRP